MKRLFRGFTLAEVLITIAILGVVAAIVLPTVLNNIDDRVIETQNKKAKAVMANGIKMLTAQTVSPYLKDTQLKRCGYDSECIAAEIKKSFKVVDDNLSSPDKFSELYFANDDDEDGFYAWSEDEGVNYAFSTADGAIFGVFNNGDDRNSLVIVTDANGIKNPNILGRDLCLFTFDETGQLISSDEVCPVEINESRLCSIMNLAACNQQQCSELPSRISSTANCSYVWSGGQCMEACQIIPRPRPQVEF